jgi:hypothetical protein
MAQLLLLRASVNKESADAVVAKVTEGMAIVEGQGNIACEVVQGDEEVAYWTKIGMDTGSRSGGGRGGGRGGRGGRGRGGRGGGRKRSRDD